MISNTVLMVPVFFDKDVCANNIVFSLIPRTLHWHQFKCFCCIFKIYLKGILPLSCKEVYSYLSDVLTTILSVSSRTFLVLLHNAKADEWENITGASLASIVSLDVFRELCDRSIIMPSRFSSFITVYCKMKNIYTFVAIVTLSLSHCLQFHLHFLCTPNFFIPVYN